MTGVLIVAERALPERGGLAVATSRIAAQAAARGERVHLVRLSGDAAPGARGRREQGGVVEHPVGPLSSVDESLMALAAHARELIHEYELDLVHGIFATRAGWVAAVVGRELSIASVVSIRGNDLDRGLFRPTDLPLLSAAIRRAQVVTAVSRAATDTASRVFGRSVEYLTNSVDATAFAPAERDAALAARLGLDDAPVIGFSGELREKKGMRFLLPAFADVLRRRPVQLLLIGGVRAEAEAALAAFRSAAPEAAARLVVAPYQRHPAELSKLLSLCDVLVFPSLFEGTPNAVLEAMAAARPVLCTAVGGHVDLIEHGVSGALLSLGELDRLPAAIEELLDLPAERRAGLGRAARERALARHAPPQESRDWAAVYARARALARARRP